MRYKDSERSCTIVCPILKEYARLLRADLDTQPYTLYESKYYLQDKLEQLAAAADSSVASQRMRAAILLKHEMNVIERIAAFLDTGNDYELPASTQHVSWDTLTRLIKKVHALELELRVKQVESHLLSRDTLVSVYLPQVVRIRRAAVLLRKSLRDSTDPTEFLAKIPKLIYSEYQFSTNQEILHELIELKVDPWKRKKEFLELRSG